jgi:hypothetical protein
MALFFDAPWFDERLTAFGLSRTVVAVALGLTDHELADIWKDQRELRAHDVAVLAALLGTDPQDIATRAGVSTPVPGTSPSSHDVENRLARIEERLAVLERLIARNEKN